MSNRECTYEPFKIRIQSEDLVGKSFKACTGRREEGALALIGEKIGGRPTVCKKTEIAGRGSQSSNSTTQPNQNLVLTAR